MLTLHPIQINNSDAMKKTYIIIISLLLPVLALGQVQINTKKVKISDFTQKVTKVVLSGNDLFDSALQDEITTRWRVSPYEFCSLDDFEKLKTNDEYYFLMSVEGQFKKESEPSILFLTLVKGGKGAEKGISGLLEVVSVPISSAKFPSGREHIFLPAFLDIIQTHTLNCIDKDINAYGGLGNYTSNIDKASDMTIVFSEDDLSQNVTKMVKDQFFDGSIIVTGEEQADAYVLENAENTLVSYTVSPFDPAPGSFCYKMLIDTQSHRLYFFKKHKITKKVGTGFLKDDILRITAGRAR